MTRKKIKSVTNDTKSVTAKDCQDGGQLSPASGDVSKRTRNKGGRPPVIADPVAKLNRDRDLTVRAQRSDCNRLHRMIKDTLNSSDKGAGTSGKASAISQLTRATEVLHRLQVDAYGMHGDSRGVQAVIILPAVAVNMETWQAMRAAIPGQGLPAEDRRELKRIEADVYGDEGADE